MTEEEYRSYPAVNKSTLWEMHKSPAHYKYLMDHDMEDTDAFRIGRAIHSAVLTPVQFKNGYAKAPDVDRRTKAGKEALLIFESMNNGKEILTASEYDMAKEIADHVRRNPDVKKLLQKTQREKVILWDDQETGMACKCKCDAIRKGLIIDLKTAQDASTDTFTKEAVRYGYDVQTAHYCLAHESLYGCMPEWYFIVVEKKPPYAMNILKADNGFIDYGYFRRQTLMEKLQHCKEAGEWADYGTNNLIMPEWMVSWE